MCRTPEKMYFSSIRSAAQAVLEQHAQHDRSFEIYQCADHFHMTTSDKALSVEVLARLEEAAR